MSLKSLFQYRLTPEHVAAKPLRLLFYVELILLSMGTLVSFTTAMLYQTFQVPWLELLLVGLFCVMGLYLPLTRLWPKLLYTATEFSILGILLWIGLDHIPMMRSIPILSIVIMIRSCQIFQTQGRLVIAGLTFGLHLMTALTLGHPTIRHNLAAPYVQAPESWQINILQSNVIIVFGLVLLFIFLLVDALLSAHNSRQKLAIAHTQLQQYAAQVEDQAALQERNRIAREIHDSLGHSLTAQTILLENVLLFWERDDQRAKTYLLDAKDSAYQALKDVSRSVAALRDVPQSDRSLDAALSQLVYKVCQSTAIRPMCEITITTPLSNELNLAAYRIVQEALTNAVKHSRASHLSVHVVTKPQSLYLQVLDNGKGFDPSKNTSGFGLRGMRERAIALGGTCQIWSAPGSGCRISVILPLAKPVGHSA